MTRILPVISSLRGSGKTTIGSQIACFFAEKSNRTCILSFELVKDRKNKTIGVTPHTDLTEALGEGSIATKTPFGFDVIAGGYDIEMSDDSQFAHMADFDMVLEGMEEYDTIILDTPYGITRPAVVSALSCHEALLILTPEEGGFQKSRDMLKLLKENGFLGELYVVLNKCFDEKISKGLLHEFRLEVENLDIPVKSLHSVSFDDAIIKGFNTGDVLGSLSSKSAAKKGLKKIFKDLFSRPSNTSSHLIPDPRLFWQQFAMISQLPMPFIEEIKPQEVSMEIQKDKAQGVPPPKKEYHPTVVDDSPGQKVVPVLPISTQSIDYLLTRIADSLSSISGELSAIRHLINNKPYDTISNEKKENKEKIYLEFEKFLEEKRQE